MPSKDQMERVIQKIEWLKSMSYFQEEGRVPETASDTTLPWWEDLSRSEQEAVLSADVSWEGFTEAEEQDVIRRVTEGEDSEFWMDGIGADDDRLPTPDAAVAVNAKALAAEIRADEQAARTRDYGEADAATYPERVAEGSRMPVTDYWPEFERLMHDIAVPRRFEDQGSQQTPKSEYERMLEESARQGSYRNTNKEKDSGPER